MVILDKLEVAMAKRTYTIMGATGQIGQQLTQQLLKRGHRVKALGRDQERLAALQSQGAETIALEDFIHEEALSTAFKGSDAAFCMIPPNYFSEDLGSYQDQVGEAIKKALQKSPIPYILNLSSIGGQLPESTGPIKGLFRQEQRLNMLSNHNILHLRAGFFMENLLWSIPTIKQTGVHSMALSGDSTATYDRNTGHRGEGCRLFRALRF